MKVELTRIAPDDSATPEFGRWLLRVVVEDNEPADAVEIAMVQWFQRNPCVISYTHYTDAANKTIEAKVSTSGFDDFDVEKLAQQFLTGIATYLPEAEQFVRVMRGQMHPPSARERMVRMVKQHPVSTTAGGTSLIWLIVLVFDLLRSC